MSFLSVQCYAAARANEARKAAAAAEAAAVAAATDWDAELAALVATTPAAATVGAAR